MIGTSIPETAPSRVEPDTEIHLPEHLEVEFQNLEGVSPLVSVTAKAIHSSSPEIFYGPESLSLPPRLIALEEII